MLQLLFDLFFLEIEGVVEGVEHEGHKVKWFDNVGRGGSGL